MKTKFNVILTLLLAFVIQISFAQQKNVTGTVSDTDGMSLVGATVIISGTSNGTTTDFDGNFSIKSSVGDVLKISYLGYADQFATVNDTNNIIVVMQANDSQLDEVVITALGISRYSKPFLTH